ncbi:MAG: cupin-like domain-containing protein [Pseudanabaenaceae cyanobacterium SKYGB_i_bin29]|nr:cupin-like domain-containing protein [Pseudanabaenaceae cyanobacterium SKYG29]MDW8420329.1 cupin-like domain-containing protein [Pseudanabaenaceae cyanobacterium SKYGB_i_bin29]
MADGSVSTSRTLSPQWQAWIGQSLLLGNAPEQIVEFLVRRGLDRPAAQEEVANAANSPYTQAAVSFVKSLRKLESHMAIAAELNKLSVRSRRIDRVETITPGDFLEQYYATNTPLIMTGMMQNWSALQKWTPMYFAEKFGHVTVSVQTNRSTNPFYEIEMEKHRTEMPLRHYIDMILTAGKTNDFYMTANNGNLDRAEFDPLFEDMELFPGICRAERPQNTIFLWIGPRGTITPLHHDPCNLLMAQVYGRKKWYMISPFYTPKLYNYRGVYSAVDLTNPDYNTFPLFRDVQIIEEILYPGEVIFVPVGWWHFVEALDVSISVSMTHFVFPNAYNWQYP